MLTVVSDVPKKHVMTYDMKLGLGFFWGVKNHKCKSSNGETVSLSIQTHHYNKQSLSSKNVFPFSYMKTQFEHTEGKSQQINCNCITV